MERACLDIDGVLCIDPTEAQNDDGARYIDFILNAKPLYLPTSKINSLVTSRLEKYRPQTVEWLASHGIEYDRLIMLDLPSKEERQRLGAHASHKANYYLRSGLDLFVESSPAQAQEILRRSGKPVFCTEDNNMYSPDAVSALRKQPRRALKQGARRLKSTVAGALPPSVKSAIKRALRRDMPR